MKKSTRKSECEENTATDAEARIKKASSPRKKKLGVTSNPAVRVESVTHDGPTPGHRAPTPTEVQGLIAQRAYELYTHRGFQHGYHEDDWHEAEKQVLVSLHDLGVSDPSRLRASC